MLALRPSGYLHLSQLTHDEFNCWPAHLLLTILAVPCCRREHTDPKLQWAELQINWKLTLLFGVREGALKPWEEFGLHLSAAPRSKCHASGSSWHSARNALKYSFNALSVTTRRWLTPRAFVSPTGHLKHRSAAYKVLVDFIFDVELMKKKHMQSKHTETNKRKQTNTTDTRGTRTTRHSKENIQSQVQEKRECFHINNHC